MEKASASESVHVQSDFIVKRAVLGGATVVTALTATAFIAKVTVSISLAILTSKVMAVVFFIGVFVACHDKVQSLVARGVDRAFEAIIGTNYGVEGYLAKASEKVEDTQ